MPLESRFVGSNRGWWPSNCLFGFSGLPVTGDFSRTIVLGSFIHPNALEYSSYKSDIYIYQCFMYSLNLSYNISKCKFGISTFFFLFFFFEK